MTKSRLAIKQSQTALSFFAIKGEGRMTLNAIEIVGKKATSPKSEVAEALKSKA